MDPTYLASFGELEDEHWWFRARREIVFDQLRQAGVDRAADILDVGAGTGGMLGFLSAAIPAACCRGVEPDEGAREHCRSRGVDVVAGSADPLPVETGSHDVITLLDVLEHLDNDVSAVRELVRVLRPGGFALITVPAYQWLWAPHDELNGHKRRYNARELRRVLVEGGLEVESTTYFNTLLFPAAVVQRMLSRLSGKRSEEEQLPLAPLNALAYAVFSVERRALRHVRLPWGVSILAIARKPAR